MLSDSEGGGFIVGKVSPCYFHVAAWGMCGPMCSNHFVFVGWNISAHTATRFETNAEAAGPGHCEPRRVLSRSMRRTPEGVVYESGHRHADRLNEKFGSSPRMSFGPRCVSRGNTYAQKCRSRWGHEDPVVQRRQARCVHEWGVRSSEQHWRANVPGDTVSSTGQAHACTTAGTGTKKAGGEDGGHSREEDR